MSYSHINEPTIGFDYESVYKSLDPPAVDLDEQAWAKQAELLNGVLRWLITGRDLAGVGARTYTLALYVNPALVGMSSLAEICRLQDSPTKQALSKALLEFQREYNLKPAPFQKLAWMRERYRMAAFYWHWRHEGAFRYELSSSVAGNPVERD